MQMNTPNKPTPHDAAIHAKVSVGSFFRRYPAAAIDGKISRILPVLGDYYQGRHFTVMTCSSWENTLRKIQPGQVWLVWKPGQDLRVLGMMPGGRKVPPIHSAVRAFFRRLDDLGRPGLVDVGP